MATVTDINDDDAVATRKRTVDDLAAFGGKPIFDNLVHVGRPNVANVDEVMARFREVFDRNWLTNAGPNVQEFERRVAERLGVKHVIAMCNGTVALEIAIRAADLTGEVIVPSFTFVATAHALQWQQITPVFCDVDPVSHTIDPEQIERLITPRTTGILAVHLWGRPANVEALEAIAKKHNLKLLFDAAHGFCSTYKQRCIGGFGDAEVFSFHATKFFNTLEGGAVCTNDDEMARTMRLMKNFGFTGYDQVSHVGTNGKMNEISAAMGLTQLDAIDSVLAVNSRNERAYRQNIQAPGVRMIDFPEGETMNYQYIVTEIDEAEAGLSRDEIISLLHAENILARRYFYPGCHRMEPYRSYFPNAGMMLPVTERLTQRVMCLPTGTSVNEDSIRAIGSLIGFIVQNSAEIRARGKLDFVRGPQFGSTGVSTQESR